MPHKDLETGGINKEGAAELGVIDITPSRPAPQVVTGPLGEMVTVVEGGTVEGTMKSIEDFYNKNPESLGAFFKKKQTEDIRGVSGDIINPGMLPSAQTRRAFLASQFSFGLAPGGLDDLGVRFGLGRADLMVEKMVILKQNYPDSQIEMARDLDGQPVIGIRHPGEPLGIEVESPEFTPGDIAMLASGVLSEDVAMELLVFGVTPVATTVKAALLKAFVAGTSGELIKSFVERSRDRELSSAGAIAERMLITGAAGATGSAIFDRVARTRNLIQGVTAKAGMINVGEAGRRGQVGSAELGLKQPLVGDLHPKWRNAQNQAASLNLKLETEINDRLGAAYDKLADDAAAMGDVRLLTDNELRSILAKREAQITAGINSPPTMTWENAGNKVQAGWSKFEELLAEAEGRDYVKARAGTRSGIYDIAPIKALMGNLKFGTRGPVTIKGKGWTLRTHINVDSIKDKELKSAMNDLGLLDDEIKLIKLPKGETQDPLSIMIALRSRFFNIMEDRAVRPKDRAVAAQIHHAMTQSMMHPQGVGPDAVALWRRAANRTRFSEDITSKSYTRMIANSDNPKQIAQYLASGSNPTAAKNIKRWLVASGQRDKWIAVESAFKNMLLDTPTDIRAILSKRSNRNSKAFDPLMPPVEQEAYLKIGDDVTRMQKGEMFKMLKEGEDEGLRLVRLAEQGTRKEISEYIIDVGGKETPRGRQLAAGVLTSLLNASSKQGTLRIVLNKNTFLDKLEVFRRRGIMNEVFTPQDLKHIQSYEDAFTFLPEGIGMGDKLVAAEQASAVTSIFVGQPGKALSGGRGFLKNNIVAWIILSKNMNRLIAGGAKVAAKRAPVSVKGAQALGAAIGTVVENMDEITKTSEGFKEFLGELGVGSLETDDEFTRAMERIPR